MVLLSGLRHCEHGLCFLSAGQSVFVVDERLVECLFTRQSERFEEVALRMREESQVANETLEVLARRPFAQGAAWETATTAPVDAPLPEPRRAEPPPPCRTWSQARMAVGRRDTPDCSTKPAATSRL